MDTPLAPGTGAFKNLGAALIDKSARASCASADCGLCRAQCTAADLPVACTRFLGGPRCTPAPHVDRPRLQRGQGQLRGPRGARVWPRPGEWWHLFLRLQAVREAPGGWAEGWGRPGRACAPFPRRAGTMDSARQGLGQARLRPRPGCTTGSPQPTPRRGLVTWSPGLHIARGANVGPARGVEAMGDGPAICSRRTDPPCSRRFSL